MNFDGPGRFDYSAATKMARMFWRRLALSRRMANSAERVRRSRRLKLGVGQGRQPLGGERPAQSFWIAV